MLPDAKFNVLPDIDPTLSVCGVGEGRLVRFAPLIAGSTEGNRASGKVPDVRSEADVVTGRLVKFAPLIAGSVAGNRASANVPDVRSEAEVVTGRLVSPEPSPVKAVAANVPVTVAPADVVSNFLTLL